MRLSATSIARLALPLVSLMALPALADSIPAIAEGTAFSAARGTLMSKGFKPVPSGNQDLGRCSAGRRDVCSAYPETVSCSGTGAAPCRFIFSGPGNTTVTVVAEGQDAGRLKVTASRRSAQADVEWQRKAVR